MTFAMLAPLFADIRCSIAATLIEAIAVAAAIANRHSNCSHSRNDGALNMGIAARPRAFDFATNEGNRIVAIRMQVGVELGQHVLFLIGGKE